MGEQEPRLLADAACGACSAVDAVDPDRQLLVDQLPGADLLWTTQ